MPEAVVMPCPLVAIRELEVPLKGEALRVELGLPRSPAGLIFLARDNGNVLHGHALAFSVRSQGFGTAVCHLLTASERETVRATRKLPLHPEQLARRLAALVDVVSDDGDLGGLPAGIAASGFAAAAALRVAVMRPLAFDAIVCRRPNLLFTKSLQYVRPATLFLAVTGDVAKIHTLTRAFQRLQCNKRFELVPGTSPSFEDDLSFAYACDLTNAWLRRHLGGSSRVLPGEAKGPQNEARTYTRRSPGE